MTKHRLTETTTARAQIARAAEWVLERTCGGKEAW